MSQLMFWNKQNNNNNSNNAKETSSKDATGDKNDKNGKRNWLHTPEALINGHIVYLVKFFGHLPVEQAKGIDVVKDAIRKLQFAQQMKKAETGTQEKFKKVEITISVDGVAVQEPRTQKILHQFPLHNISYCADEKGVKKFFSFIAKTTGKAGEVGNTLNGGSNGDATAEETHECFIFISNKLASDITLTIGQAFDLAYRKYINNAEKTDLGKAQQQIAQLEKTIGIYKDRLRDLAAKLPKSELDALLFKYSVKDILDVPVEPTNGATTLTNGNKSANEDTLLIDTNSTHSMKSSTGSTSAFVPIVPPRNNIPTQMMHKSNSQKMDELLLNSDSDSDFDPRAEESLDSGSGSGKNDSSDLFGFEPAKSFGQQLFFNNNDNKLPNNNSGNNGTVNFSNNINSINNFTNELNITPPLLAPPPKVAAPRRSTSVTNTGNGITNANSSNNLMNGGGGGGFGVDFFDLDPFGSAKVMESKGSAISVDDFLLGSLDPLRK